MKRKKLIALMLSLTLLGAGGLSTMHLAQAEDRDDLVAQNKQRRDRMASIRSELEGIDTSLQETFIKLEETRNQIPAAEAALLEAQNSLAAANREAQQKAALLEAAQNELAEISNDKEVAAAGAASSRKNLAELARLTYRGEGAPSTVDLLLGSATAQEFLNAYRITSAISRTHTAALVQHETASASILNREARQEAVEEVVAQLKADADALVVKQEKATAQANAKRDELNALEAQMAQYSAELKQRQSEYQASLAQIQKEYESTAAEIARIDEENRRKNQTISGNYGSGWLGTPIPQPFYITSPFGYRSNPFGGLSEFHSGLDIGSPCGQTQVAAANGTVVRVVPASAGSIGGNMVTINHGMVNGASYQTMHAHLSAIHVYVGQSVSKGQSIGLTGATGRVTGCHVHFEVWQNGTPINPMSMF